LEKNFPCEKQTLNRTAPNKNGSELSKAEASPSQERVQKAFLSGFSTSEISLWEGEAFAEQKAREGEAPAEPKLSANRKIGQVGKNLGSPGGLPSQSGIDFRTHSPLRG